jgi:hypothetical protein
VKPTLPVKKNMYLISVLITILEYNLIFRNILVQLVGTWKSMQILNFFNTGKTLQREHINTNLTMFTNNFKQ